MSTEETETGVTPEDCELERFERNHYFDGKLLTARDMADEQAYHVDRLATLARYVLGDGVVCGLSVSVAHAAGEEDVTVTVSPGMALDCCGNLVVLEDGATEDVTPGSTDTELYLYLRYRECFRESVPIPNSGDACEEACEFNRVLEVFDVVAESSPLGDGVDPSLGSMAFPREGDLAAREPAADLEGDDPELLRIARTYHGNHGIARRSCPECEDPHVYLGRLERDADTGVWDVVADSGTDFVYPNELLYAAISRHSADFRNPHETSLAVLDAVVSGDESSARVMVEDEATDAEAVTLSADTEYIDIDTPGGKTIQLTTEGITELASTVSDLQDQVNDLAGDVADNTTAIGENASDIADNASDIADNASDIDRLERYVMDKTLKYKAECFGGLAETFHGTVAGDVAAAVVERTWRGIDKEVYEDAEEFREFVGGTSATHEFDRPGLDVTMGRTEMVVELGDHSFVVTYADYDGEFRETDDGFEVELTLVELERLVGDALVGLARQSRKDATTYPEAVTELEDVLDHGGTPLDVAIAQDLVCETAEWLEAVEDIGVPGVLTAEVAADTVAAAVDDSVTLSGNAVEQGDDVRVYLVGPNGEFLDADGDEGAETVDVDGEAFAQAYTAFEEPGPYVFLVVGRGRDGVYASDIGFGGGPDLPTGMSQAEAVDAVLSSYGADDADDPVVRVETTGVEPTVDIDDFTSARRGTVVVRGTTNLADGNTVDLGLRSGGRAPFIRQATATVADRRWSAPFDLSNVETGQYTVTASAGSASDQQAFTLLPRGTGPVIDDVVIRDDVVRDDIVRDDFTVISGIGEARAEALNTAGFLTMRDVAEANPRELADELGISRRLAREIVREADERRSG